MTSAANRAHHPPPAVILQTDPARDAFTRATPGDHMRARLLYQRNQESHTQALPNQDYALLTATPAARSLCFCVCDGVGSSFQGGFAAAFLARHLVDWLAALGAIPSAGESVRDDLSNALLTWARSAHAELCDQPIAHPGGALIREVLQSLRDDFGSETVFLAGRIDIPVPTTPADPDAPAHAGDPSAQVLLVAMGNLTARLFTHSERGAPPTIYHGDDRSRWSTARHLRGELTISRAEVPTLRRLIIHSDGADSISEQIAQLPDAQLRDAAAALRTQPTSDDITILDIQWDHDDSPAS